MGADQSTSVIDETVAPPPPPPPPPQIKQETEFKKKEFQAIRSENTVESALAAMKQIGIYLNDLDPSSVDLDQIKKPSKLLFVMCNTYTKEKYKLGPGPLNDSLSVAINTQKIGYRMVFLHNCPHKQFLAWLKVILENCTGELCIFYTGHGANIRDTSGDEEDGKDEVMVFDDGYIVDDVLVQHLADYSKAKKTILLTDCCHSGSIWDIQSAEKKGIKLPANIISISAAKDEQTAKQTKMQQKDQGIFSFYFWRSFNKNTSITSNEMAAQVNKFLAKFKQMYVVAATSPILDQPIFTC